MAFLVSSVVTMLLYFKQGMPPFNDEIYTALYDIFRFWFAISWSLTLLIALFRGFRDIFNTCYGGYEIKLLECFSNVPKGEQPEVLDEVGYGDMIKVWRKWFMLLIWLVGSMMVLALTFTYIFTSYGSVFDWFNIYWLFSFILICGYFSFMIFGIRCKRCKIVRC